METNTKHWEGDNCGCIHKIARLEIRIKDVLSKYETKQIRPDQFKELKWTYLRLIKDIEWEIWDCLNGILWWKITDLKMSLELGQSIH